MTTTRFGIAGGLLAAVMALTAGPADAQRRFGRRDQAEVRGVVKALDAKAGTLTLTTFVGRGTPAEEKTYTLAKDVEVALGHEEGRGGPGLFKEGKLADVAAGVPVVLTLAGDQKTVASILAMGPVVRGWLKSVDAQKKTLTVSAPAQRGRGRGDGRGERGEEEKTYAVAPDAEVVVDEGRGRRFSLREAKLADLVGGAQVTLWLSVDQKQAEAVLAEGPAYSGTVKAVDGAAKTLTLVVRPPRGEDAGEEKVLTVPTDALVLVDDGKGRRLSVRKVKLADVPAGAAASVKMSPDQAVVMTLRAEGPTIGGLLKAVDPDKRLLTIAIPKGRGEEPEEKTLPVVKGAWVVIEGNTARLKDLKADENGPAVQLKLTLDQKAIQAVMTHAGRSR